jgi:hypothetical protein
LLTLGFRGLSPDGLLATVFDLKKLILNETFVLPLARDPTSGKPRAHSRQGVRHLPWVCQHVVDGSNRPFAMQQLVTKRRPVDARVCCEGNN